MLLSPSQTPAFTQWQRCFQYFLFPKFWSSGLPAVQSFARANSTTLSEEAVLLRTYLIDSRVYNAFSGFTFDIMHWCIVHCNLQIMWFTSHHTSAENMFDFNKESHKFGMIKNVFSVYSGNCFRCRTSNQCTVQERVVFQHILTIFDMCFL